MIDETFATVIVMALHGNFAITISSYHQQRKVYGAFWGTVNGNLQGGPINKLLPKKIV